MDGVQESRQQGADDAAKGFGGVVEAHDQILLGRVCPGGHHVLQYGDTDGIPGVQRDAAGEEDGDLRRKDGSQGGQGAGAHQHHRGFSGVGLSDNPQAQGHIEQEGHEAHHGFDDAVIGGGQPQLVFQIVVEHLVEAGISQIDEDVHQKQKDKGGIHEILAVPEGIEGVALGEKFLDGHFIGAFRIRLAAQPEHNAADDHGDCLQNEGGADGKFSYHPADERAEGAEYRMDGGAVGQISCRIPRPCHIDHVGQQTDEDTAEKRACQKPNK